MNPLIRRSATHFECGICHQHFRTKPRAVEHVAICQQFHADRRMAELDAEYQVEVKRGQELDEMRVKLQLELEAIQTQTAAEDLIALREELA